MLYHNKCHNQVHLNCTDAIMFLTTFGFGKQRLNIGVGSIVIKPSGTSHIKSLFYCTECNEEVPVKDIIVQCSECGETFPVENISIVQSSGGLYCKHCVDYLFGEEEEKIVPLSTIIPTVNFRS